MRECQPPARRALPESSPAVVSNRVMEGTICLFLSKCTSHTYSTTTPLATYLSSPHIVLDPAFRLHCVHSGWCRTPGSWDIRSPCILVLRYDASGSCFATHCHPKVELDDQTNNCLITFSAPRVRLFKIQARRPPLHSYRANPAPNPKASSTVAIRISAVMCRNHSP